MHYYSHSKEKILRTALALVTLWKALTFNVISLFSFLNFSICSYSIHIATIDTKPADKTQNVETAKMLVYASMIFQASLLECVDLCNKQPKEADRHNF